MPNLINISQLRQDQISGFFQVPLTSATGVLFSIVTGQQLTSGQFDSRYVKNTGAENISGVKSFFSRPTVFGTGILVSGEVYLLSNPSGYTNIKVTGSSNILTPNFTGVGGAQVILSGNNILISGGAGQQVAGSAMGVNSIIATGSVNTGYFTGDVMLSGAGNITAFTGNNISKLVIISGNTGAYANFALSSATGQFITTAQTGQFSSTQITGSPALAVANFTGAGNITMTTGGGTLVIVSGNTGAYANFITPSQTGNFSSTQVTGSPALAVVNLTGAGNVSVTTGGGTLVIISGDTGAYANFGAGGPSTGQAIIFDSGIQLGVSRQSFIFPITFNLPPYVVTQIKHLGLTGAGTPTVGVSGVSTTGFTGIFNTGFNTTGYVLTIYAASGALPPTISVTPPATISRGISLFTPYILTGLTIQEAFVPVDMTTTGWAIGCTASGTGPAHLSSGASGAPIWSPLTGSFYQRATGGSTSTIAVFSLNSGALYSSQTISNIIVTGRNRVGVQILSGLSGIENISFGLFGTV